MHEPLPAVYYTCSYVPPEVIWAAGCRPVRLLPSAPAPGECDAFLPRDLCPYVRGAFWDLYRRAPPAAAVVLTTCCDPMRRLADVLRQYSPHVPCFLLDLPRTRGKREEEYLAARLDELFAALTKLPGAVPPAGGLAEASRLFAEVRQLLRQAARTASAPALHRLVRRVYTADPREALTSLGAPGDAASGSPAHAHPRGSPADAHPRDSAADARPRVLVVTSHPVDPGVLEVIEQAGARVVAEDSCLGDRLLTIPPGGSTPRELAAAYLGRPPCPRMELPEERLAYLGDLARAHGAHGIIFLALKYCDNLGYDFPWVLERSALPVLFLESDYGISTSGQLLTRVQAFVETLPLAGPASPRPE